MISLWKYLVNIYTVLSAANSAHLCYNIYSKILKKPKIDIFYQYYELSFQSKTGVFSLNFGVICSENRSRGTDDLSAPVWTVYVTVLGLFRSYKPPYLLYLILCFAM